MEQFIPEVGLTSESEPKEIKNLLTEATGTFLKEVHTITKNVLEIDEEDEESSWIFFGVGGPA